jgi:hypothetical protein
VAGGRTALGRNFRDERSKLGYDIFAVPVDGCICIILLAGKCNTACALQRPGIAGRHDPDNLPEEKSG